MKATNVGFFNVKYATAAFRLARPTSGIRNSHLHINEDIYKLMHVEQEKVLALRLSK